MNELVRIVADWLEDGTNGINAQLDLVPRDNGDAQPADVTITDLQRPGPLFVWVSCSAS